MRGARGKLNTHKIKQNKKNSKSKNVREMPSDRNSHFNQKKMNSKSSMSHIKNIPQIDLTEMFKDKLMKDKV